VTLRSMALAMLAALLLAAAACGDGKTQSSNGPDLGAQAADRPTVGPATADWPGRTAEKACIEDPTGQFTTKELVDKVQVPYTTAVSLVSKLPASLVSPCPYDFPGGSTVVEDSVDAFTYQIYVTKDAAPSSQVLEKWQRPGTSEPLPVTFRLLIPASYVQDLGELLRWLPSVLVPEPTAKK
jgi:hypothetical protein